MKYNVNDAFFNRLREVVRKNVIPYQWEALNDRVPGASRSGCIQNLRAAAGEIEAEHYGYVFQDSDLFKWMEAAAFSLMWAPDKILEGELEDAVELVARAQQTDGYLDTYYILTGLDKRWTNLKDHHELYCAGHLFEAAVAHYRATGRDTLLGVAEKLAAHIDSVLGPEPEKMHGYPGHEEVELGLVKLYEITGKEQYLRLARYFIDERGKAPLYFEDETRKQGNDFYWQHGPLGYAYYQAHKPLLEQERPVGHAVRANYLYAGAAAVARCTKDDALYRHLRTLWKEEIEKQMYVTGQVGSSEYGEAFTFPYDLPNDTAYAETCAGLALAFFAHQMLKIERRGEYADVMERVLYNGAVSGMDLEGTAFFYVNPLEVVPEATREDKRLEHVKPVRQKWFGCACCPPNLARTLSSITDYAMACTEKEIFQHLYVAGDFLAQMGGVNTQVIISGSYPWNDTITIKIDPEKPAAFTYGLRIPGWSEGAYSLKLNGETVTEKPVDGYVYLDRTWVPGDTVTLSFDLTVKRLYAHPSVREDAGKVAIQRGPIVYCLEEADNGRDLHRVLLRSDSDFIARWEPELLGGVVILTCDGLMESGDESRLYSTKRPTVSPRELKFIPYYVWANRGEGEMTVWVRERQKKT